MAGRPNRRPRQIGRRLGRLTRGKTEMLVQQCRLTPLEVMLANMRFFYEEAALLAGDVAQLLEDRDAEPTLISEVYQKFLSSKMDAQRCAVDAAPWFHRRRVAVQIKVFEPEQMDNDDLARVIAAFVPEADLAEALHGAGEAEDGERIYPGDEQAAAE
jgi:hypothetical protein